MNRNVLSAMATSAITTVALLGVAAIATAPAYADDITIEPQAFVSSRTREAVSAELKTPYAQGNPWSGLYNMFQARSAATGAQVQREYITHRDTVAAFCAEDSGSAYIKAQSLASSPARAMGASAR
ncbi:MAG: hypothetical protein Q8R01_00510 [Ramlibacter sp.]|nr:hypothetical protein [Ramlibacter sp.]